MIKTDKEYEEALKQLEAVFFAEPDTSEGREADRLAQLICDYDERMEYEGAQDLLDRIE